MSGRGPAALPYVKEHIELIDKCKKNSNKLVKKENNKAPLPLPLQVAKAGRNNLNDKIPLLPTGIGERYSQTISQLGHAALRRCELPLETKVLN
jgi:hypothetical protein